MHLKEKSRKNRPKNMTNFICIFFTGKEILVLVSQRHTSLSGGDYVDGRHAEETNKWSNSILFSYVYSVILNERKIVGCTEDDLSNFPVLEARIKQTHAHRTDTHIIYHNRYMLTEIMCDQLKKRSQ
jgi:hypothetical protein